MEINETKIEDMIEDEIKTKINSPKIMPKNYAYILAYFTSIFNKYKKANINNIPDLIDAWIDADMFEIQIYYDKNDITRFGRISRCTRRTCYRESPINSTFCCNCNMIKLLYKKDNISDLLKLYPKNNYSSWHIMLDNYIIYQSQYEKIVSDFVKYFKQTLRNLYTK